MITQGGGGSDHIVKETEREVFSQVQHGWEIRKEENKKMITGVAG